MLKQLISLEIGALEKIDSIDGLWLVSGCKVCVMLVKVCASDPELICA